MEKRIGGIYLQENLLKLEEETTIKETVKQSQSTTSTNKYGKFTVSCVFAGDKSITELMTCYVDRKVSLKYGG